jgi:hypothetical protein
MILLDHMQQAQLSSDLFLGWLVIADIVQLVYPFDHNRLYTGNKAPHSSFY